MALIVAPVSLIGAAKSYARVYAMIKGKVKGSRHRYPIDLDSSKYFLLPTLAESTQQKRFISNRPRCWTLAA